ncbi:MAG: hypothetical protein ACI9I4_001768 [Neolewinella sp.]|jgi:hypothetical protein
MQKSFTTQRVLLVSRSDLDHPILHSLDDTKALLDWSYNRVAALSTRLLCYIIYEFITDYAKHHAAIKPL